MHHQYEKQLKTWKALIFSFMQQCKNVLIKNKNAIIINVHVLNQVRNVLLDLKHEHLLLWQFDILLAHFDIVLWRRRSTLFMFSAVSHIGDTNFGLPSFYNFFMYFFVSNAHYTNFFKFLPIFANFGIPIFFKIFSIYNKLLWFFF